MRRGPKPNFNRRLQIYMAWLRDNREKTLKQIGQTFTPPISGQRVSQIVSEESKRLNSKGA